MNTFIVDSEIVNKNCVAADLEIINETTFSANAWIHQCTYSLLTKKSLTKIVVVHPEIINAI
jgi:hypothetical protein